MKLVLSIAGVVLLSKQFLQKIFKRFAIEPLQCFKKMAGIPSGPTAELVESDSIFQQSPFQKTVCHQLLCCLVAYDHYPENYNPLWGCNTDLYCYWSRFVISLLSVIRWMFGFFSGPTFGLVFEKCLM